MTIIAKVGLAEHSIRKTIFLRAIEKPHLASFIGSLSFWQTWSEPWHKPHSVYIAFNLSKKDGVS